MAGVEDIAGLLGAIGVPEVIGVLVILLVILGARFIPGLLKGMRHGVDEFKDVTRSVQEEIRASLKEETDPPRLSVKDHLVLWFAEGFGSGLIPVAPGTFGSLVGMIWFAFLVGSGEFAVYVVGTVLGLGASVILGGAAERILREHDPSSVVLDEIAAVPVCFLPWVAIAWGKLGAMPPVAHFYEARAWMITLGIFVLFRVFDALKPWPISKIQDLPGGWGVTADDVLAAIAVASLSLLVVS